MENGERGGYKTFCITLDALDDHTLSKKVSIGYWLAKQNNLNLEIKETAPFTKNLYLFATTDVMNDLKKKFSFIVEIKEDENYEIQLKRDFLNRLNQ